MRNFTQPGDVLSLTAPDGGVVAGVGYLIGKIFVVAAIAADATEKFEGQVNGVFDLPKPGTQEWTEGAAVYWDDTAKKATTVATANSLIGVAAAAAGNPSATGLVRLNGGGIGAGDSVSTAELEDGSVTLEKAAVFVSIETTATGSEQSIAHGLGVVPSAVLVVPTELAADLGSGYDAAEGTHTSTDVLVTVTADAKFKILAWA